MPKIAAGIITLKYAGIAEIISALKCQYAQSKAPKAITINSPSISVFVQVVAGCLNITTNTISNYKNNKQNKT